MHHTGSRGNSKLSASMLVILTVIDKAIVFFIRMSTKTETNNLMLSAQCAENSDNITCHPVYTIGRFERSATETDQTLLKSNVVDGILTFKAILPNTTSIMFLSMPPIHIVFEI